MITVDELIVYSVTDAAIEKMKQDYLGLKVNGLEDKDGYQACHEARMVVKRHRVDVEKKRQELKAESLTFGRKIDTEAKRIMGQLEAIEDHLRIQQDIIDNEKKRIEEEKVRKAQEILDTRIKLCQKVSALFTVVELQTMTDSQFNAFYENEKLLFEQAEKKRKEEQERLAQLEIERHEQAAKLKTQEEENRRLQAEMIHKQNAEIAERDRLLAKKRAAREAEEKKKAEELELKRRADESKRKAEAMAYKKIADEKLFNEIKK
jgi:hypothetical protein